VRRQGQWWLPGVKNVRPQRNEPDDDTKHQQQRAYELEYRPLSALEAQIVQTPAEGLAGIAIKLALCKHYYFDTWSFSHDTLATACETMAKIQGVDLSAQVECW
jgi:hypothetical protein